MFNLKSKKLLSATLCGMMCAGIFGTTLAEAHPSQPETAMQTMSYAPDTEYKSRWHSQGEVNTAAILGAVVGAVIAKNT